MTLVLDEKGKWHTRTQTEHEIHAFEQEKRKFSITWWQSSKTFVIQGEEKYSKKVKLKIQDLLNKSKTNETPTMENPSNDNENTTPK